MQRPAAPPGDAHAYIGAERARDPAVSARVKHRPGLRSAAARRRNPLPNPRPGRNRAGAIPAARSRPRRRVARWRVGMGGVGPGGAITRSAACMASATTGDNWRPWRAEPAICIRFSDAPASSTAMASGSALWWVCKSDSTSTSMPGRAAPSWLTTGGVPQFQQRMHVGSSSGSRRAASARSCAWATARSRMSRPRPSSSAPMHSGARNRITLP